MKDDEESGTREAKASGRRQMGIDVTRTGESFQHPGQEPKKAEGSQGQIGDFAVDLVAYAHHQNRQKNQRENSAGVRVIVGQRRGQYLGDKGNAQ